ncbi:MAG: GC-type dockerin domain-anchored protein [Phycisphaerales bacterium]
MGACGGVGAVRGSVAALVAAGAVGVATPGAMAQAHRPTMFIPHYYGLGGTVVSIVLNPDGSLSIIGTYPAGVWTTAASLSPDGRYLAVSNAAGCDDGDCSFEDFRVFRVNADSTLTEVAYRKVPTSPLEVEWIDNDFVAVTVTNSGAAGSQVSSYRFDRQANQIVLVETEQVGGFCSALAVDGAARTLYTQDSTGQTIHRWQVDGAGQLALEGAFPTGGVYPLDPLLSASGEWLYTAGGISSGRDKVAGYLVNAVGSTNILGFMNGAPFISPGNSPAYLAMTDDDSIMFVGHGTDATVRSFLVDSETGALTSTGFSFDVGLQGTIGDIAVMGDKLIVTDDSTAIDGKYGAYVFQINPDGTFTQIGDILPTGTPRPEGRMAVWAPASAGCAPDLTATAVAGQPGYGVPNGVLNNDDFFYFLAEFALGNLAVCDLTATAVPGQPGYGVPNGVLSNDDFFYYLGLFAAGC